MKMFLAIILSSLIISTYAQFKCPQNARDGATFEDPIQCDKFYECVDGIAREKLCPDGLVYHPAIRKINKCDQPFTADCGDRVELQPAQPTKYCPRRNGYFAHPDAKICDTYYNCIEGAHTEVKCTKGLHFDEFTGICVWPETIGREGCDETKSKSLKDGFTCTKEGQIDSNGQVVIHPKFANPNDCQRFYVCLNGEEPRDLGCQVGEVYNEESQRCDAPENVPGCENWYQEVSQPLAKNPSKKA